MSARRAASAMWGEPVDWDSIHRHSRTNVLTATEGTPGNGENCMHAYFTRENRVLPAPRESRVGPEDLSF